MKDKKFLFYCIGLCLGLICGVLFTLAIEDQNSEYLVIDNLIVKYGETSFFIEELNYSDDFSSIGNIDIYNTTSQTQILSMTGFQYEGNNILQLIKTMEQLE